MEVKIMTVEDFLQLQNQLHRMESKLEKVVSDNLDTVTYTNEEVEKMLSISTKTLQNYRDKKLISFSQVGSKIWYTPNDVQSFLERNRIKENYLIGQSKV